MSFGWFDYHPVPQPERYTANIRLIVGPDEFFGQMVVDGDKARFDLGATSTIVRRDQSTLITLNHVDKTFLEGPPAPSQKPTFEDCGEVTENGTRLHHYRGRTKGADGKDVLMEMWYDERNIQRRVLIAAARLSFTVSDVSLDVPGDVSFEVPESYTKG